jgi:type IV pilus assembly protein PilY1
MKTERQGESAAPMGGLRRLRGLFCLGISILIISVVFSLVSPEITWAGYCSLPSPSPANLTVVAGDGGSLTLTAVPYDKAANYIWTFSPDLPAWITLSYDSNKQYRAILTIDPAAVSGSTYTGTVSVDGTKCYLTEPQTANVNIKVEPPPIMVISPSSSAVATEGSAFNRQMEVKCRDGSTGAPADCPASSWSVSGLPSGLSLDPGCINVLTPTLDPTCSIIGTPASGSGGAAGFVYTVTVRYFDESVIFSLTVYPSTLPLKISSIGLPNGKEGQSYAYTVTGTGGEHPYTWSASGLPSGFVINSSTGTITGNPAAGSKGTYNVTLTLEDNAGRTDVKTLGLLIEEAAVVTGEMDYYCVTPPFIPQDIKANVLLMIDNSASMYDLSYFDEGHGQQTDPDYRAPFYCYDQTYTSQRNYPGYFKTEDSGGNPVYYEYIFPPNPGDPGDYFTETASFPNLCTKRSVGASGVGILCIDLEMGPPITVTKFVASGNYLNWLTASKFDIEKKVLTGGKYDAGSGDLVAESRGCVGRKYLKEAVVGDYVEGSATSLGITFGVKGPPNYYNASAPSPGGQTYVQIYYGDYIAGKCQNAADVFMDETSGHLEQRTASAECLSYSKGDDYASKTQNSFIQSVQECWQYREDGTVGSDSAKGSVENFCPEIYNTKICSITNSTCNADADCPASESCVSGPSAIAAGNAAYLCSSSYAGACYNGPTNPYIKTGFVTSPVVVGGVTYNTATECIVAQHNKYCAEFFHAPVVDPTEDPSETESYGNVPSLLGDLGVQGQLKYPVRTLTVRLRTSPGSGLIQRFSDNIRFGVMQFQSVGTDAECKDPAGLKDLKCPRVCSNEPSIYCSMPQDCPTAFAAECIPLASNKDGTKVVGSLGTPAGNHTYGIINILDNLRADSWTPFAEGMYTAIAYYTQNTPEDVKVTNGPKRINDDDFNTTTDPIQSMCQKNHILLISDGMSTADQKEAVRTFASTYNDGDAQQTGSLAGDIDAVPVYFGSLNLDDLAYYAQHNNIFNPTSHPIDLTTTNITSRKPKDRIATHVVYTGTPYDEGCDYKTSDGSACDPASDEGCKRICSSTTETKSEVLMYRTAEDGGGIYHLAQDADTLQAALKKVFEAIIGRSSSGTAASVLASGEGSGANIIQAVFYPLREFGNHNVKWTGRLTNLWYYVDPFFATSTIYEDTHEDLKLNVSDDLIVAFTYDENEQKTKAERWKDDDGDLVADTVQDTIPFEDLKNLWEAGYLLWKRDLGTNPRRILTNINDSETLTAFSTTGAATFKPYLRAADDAEATNIINYVHGIDVAGYRTRTVGKDLNSDGDTDDTVDGVPETAVWKLGDVIQSTPRVASWIRLNTYHLKYGDGTYGEPLKEASLSNPADETHYITSAAYRGRGMVFAGANDGMLHAFKLGSLRTFPSGNVKAELSGTGLGEEVWAFIPKNVLPYLKYTTDPNYCHIYTVDLAPYLFDASIGADLDRDNDGTDDQPDAGCNDANYWKCVKTAESWRTILIGGMRLGGACRKSNGSCTDCVKAPGVDLNGDGDTNDVVSGVDETAVGLTSYFALDITDTLNNPAADPKLLWEFADEGLGFSTSGPVIVKISTKVGGDSNGDSREDELDPADTLTNGKWFAVFASGPTGPVSTADHQFLGRADQALKIFVLELRSGTMINRAMNTNIAHAFGGSMINATDDLDKLDYQDDVFYVPYVKRTGPAGNQTWTDGGVLRVNTHGDIDPTHWIDSKLIDGIGPVTSATVRLHDPRKAQHWVYFGTGRYYFEQEPADDPTGANRIFGVKDPCFPGASGFFASACPAALKLTDLEPVDNIAVAEGLNPDSSSFKGWYINLDPYGTGTVDDPESIDPSDTIEINFRSERMITDPLAITGGVVFFTTFQPRDNVCEPGGRSYIWATKYNTGGDAGALLKGKALLQVSTGEIKQLDLADAFSEKDGRRTSEISGVPPIAQGLSILTSPPPVKRVIHMFER